MPLKFSISINDTQRSGEHRGLLKQSNRRHRDTIAAWSNRKKLQDWLKILYSKHLSQTLSVNLCFISVSLCAITTSVILRLVQLTFIFICCHFNIYVEFIVNQQVKHSQPMTEVTGKFVLKCRTTNIATLFDISLFYVYKFYFIYFPQV